MGRPADDGVTMDRAALDAALIAAHRADDLPRLVALYLEAADRFERDGDRDGCCFFLTHAYVFALETGDARARDLHARLKARGREE